MTFESHFDRFRPIPRENTWKEAENPANGMLFDLGPHLVDQVLALFGAPDAITASVRADRDETAIEDAFDITLHYPGKNGKGLLAHCRTSYLACDNAPRFLLHGTKGSFKKHGLDPQEPTLVGGAKVPMLGSKEVWLQEKESAWGKLDRRAQCQPIRPCWSSTRSRPNSATIAASTPTCATQSSARPRSPSPPKTATASPNCWNWPAKAPPKAAP